MFPVYGWGSLGKLLKKKKKQKDVCQEQINFDVFLSSVVGASFCVKILKNSQNYSYKLRSSIEKIVGNIHDVT